MPKSPVLTAKDAVRRSRIAKKAQFARRNGELRFSGRRTTRDVLPTNKRVALATFNEVDDVGSKQAIFLRKGNYHGTARWFYAG